MEEKIIKRQEIHCRIEKLRTEYNGMTQSEFALALGMDEKKGRITVNNWEQGLTQIKSRDIANIAKTFSVSADWLLGLADDPAFETNKRAVMSYTGLSESSIDFIVENNFILSQINDFLPESFDFFLGMKNAKMSSRRAEEYIQDEESNSDARLVNILRELRYSAFDLMESEKQILNKCYKLDILADTIIQILKNRKSDSKEA